VITPRPRPSGIGQVICSTQDCGFTMGSGVAGNNEIVFGPGWVKVEGCWQMSRRAWARLSQGRKPAFRRPPPDGHSKRRRPDQFGRMDQLPVDVRCPACGRRQTVSDVL
jgi:hypothetical protein